MSGPPSLESGTPRMDLDMMEKLSLSELRKACEGAEIETTTPGIKGKERRDLLTNRLVIHFKTGMSMRSAAPRRTRSLSLTSTVASTTAAASASASSSSTVVVHSEVSADKDMKKRSHRRAWDTRPDAASNNNDNAVSVVDDEDTLKVEKTTNNIALKEKALRLNDQIIAIRTDRMKAISVIVAKTTLPDEIQNQLHKILQEKQRVLSEHQEQTGSHVHSSFLTDVETVRKMIIKMIIKYSKHY